MASPRRPPQTPRHCEGGQARLKNNEHDKRSPHGLPCRQVDYGAATLHGTEIPCFCTSPTVNIDNASSQVTYNVL